MLNNNWDKLDAAVGGKVDKSSGKGLSSNDYTTEDKSKLDGATSAATPTRIILRDSAGRAKVAAPAAADDIARKDTVDAAVQPLQADLTNANSVGISLVPGQQIVTVPRDTPLNISSIKGRTLVNLFGRNGGCESIVPNSATSGSISLDTANFTQGQSSIKFTKTTSTFANYFPGSNSQRIIPQVGDNYAFIADIKGSLATLKIEGVGVSYSTYKTGSTATGAAFETQILIFKVFSITSPGTNSFLPYISISGNAGDSINIDSARLYKISESDVATISLVNFNVAQVANYFPYVDDMKNVNGIYIKQLGNNLLPPIIQWTNGRTDGQYKANSIAVISPDEVQITVGVGSSAMLTTIVDLLPNTTYTASGVLSAVYVYELGVYGSFVANLTSGKSFTTTSATKYVIGAYKAGAQSSPFTIKNVTLSLGSSAIPYERQNEQYSFYPDANLASNLDGSVYDELYTDNTGQTRVIRMFQSMDLTGDLNWSYANTYTGIKEVKLTLKTPQADSGIITKYDGKILVKKADGVQPTSGDMQTVNVSTLFLSIAAADSGWGDSYTPTTDEIKAYFYGWKMSGSGTNSNTLYTSGTKYWWVMNLDGTVGGVTATLPIQQGIADFKYRLQYQLAVQMDEPIRSEGSLMLTEGANTIEVGTGAVMRERAIPSGATNYSNRHLNFKDGANVNIPSGNQFKNRAKSIVAIFKNRLLDKLWTAYSGISDGSAYGSARADILESNFDLSAVYEVTYLALDTYQIGIAPTIVTTLYSPNAREVTDGLVKASQQLMGRVSVLENGTVQAKVPQWITPTLLNGWQLYSNQDKYRPQYKKVGNLLEIKGVVCGGNLYNPIFLLPKEFRPISNFSTANPAAINSGFVTSNLCIDPDGRVFIALNAATGTNGENYNYINAILPLD
ncbi:hypothetical protein [Paenibacillus sp. P22]|uniref:hypothetical protein n=1 Tax=Paenibacillus sp. P22 TaxID=483908 RepID=UPI00043379C1|nr:hypothetical protein [Paenibacillus sp. P22]CDN45035.1 Uncharacterized protein BN871_GG_00040 [Paenibacillus sp. P22]